MKNMIALLVVMIAGQSSLCVAGVFQEKTSDKQAVRLEYAPAENVQTVTVAGIFNNWDKNANPLKRAADGKIWSLTLLLEPGAYPYKFVVNGNVWRNDPNTPLQSDGNGNVNSLLIVVPVDYKTHPGKMGDGHITPSAVRHQANAAFVRREDKDHLALRLRTRHNDVQSSTLVVQETAKRERLFAMNRVASDALYDYWRCLVPIPHPSSLRYAFRLKDGSITQTFDGTGRLRNGSPVTRWLLLDMAQFPPFETPDWAQDAIFYQIFPERFANGDTTNDPADVEPWNAKPTFSNWLGGDLAGVMQKMDYLRDLGINALYFNPVFAARSNHAYDTTDYRNIDPRFGTNAALKTLTTKAHALGWHIILDAVFNHTGVDFGGFQSLRTEGAKSPYRSWYFVKGFPLEIKDGQQNYMGWFGSPWMPKLNVLNPETRDFLLDVGTRWIKEAQIDGWRLDAADEVSEVFWKQFRRKVRAAKPDAFIVGEMWGDASRWLQGDQWDSVMNYRWRGAALDFFALEKSTPTAFDAALAKIRDDYPPAATAVVFNMLGSHDVERLRTLCKGDRQRQTQAVLFQMTYPGVPCIYYGDEIGMEGGRDPDNRRAMLWDETQWDKPMRDFYKQVIGLRNAHPSLRRGTYRTVLKDDQNALFGFVRTHAKERALVLFNRSTKAQRITLPLAEIGKGRLTDWLGKGTAIIQKGGNLLIDLPPKGIALLGTE